MSVARSPFRRHISGMLGPGDGLVGTSKQQVIVARLVEKPERVKIPKMRTPTAVQQRSQAPTMSKTYHDRDACACQMRADEQARRKAVAVDLVANVDGSQTIWIPDSRCHPTTSPSRRINIDIYGVEINGRFQASGIER